MPTIMKSRNFPELQVDPMQVKDEDLKPKFIHLEDDLYYQFIPLLDGYIAYFGRKGDSYYEVYHSLNIGAEREGDITVARIKWAQHYTNRIYFSVLRRLACFCGLKL